jgi:hypothetical protein
LPSVQSGGVNQDAVSLSQNIRAEGEALSLPPPSMLLFRFVIQSFDAGLENFCNPLHKAHPAFTSKRQKWLSIKDKAAIAFYQMLIRAI